MKKEWKQPFWTNATKDRLTCRLNIHHDDGSFSTSVATVHKFDANGSISKDYEEILDQNSIEDIEKVTLERIERHRKERAAHIQRKEEIEKSKSLELVFNKKLEAFQIEAIKNSTNRELKSKLRKAKSEIELHAYATIIIMESMNEQKESKEPK